MSDVYIQRLRAVRDDLGITREALKYIELSWHKQDVPEAIRLFTQPRVQKAEASLEITYFVRLTAEFEGILKDHLQTNHLTVKFPALRRDWKVDWFLKKVIQREDLNVQTDLRSRLDEIRDYRNALAHGNQPSLNVTFITALARYNTFLALLPDPYN